MELPAFKRDATDLAGYTAFVALCYALCIAVSPSDLKGAARRDFAAILLWVPLTPILLMSAGSGVHELSGSLDERLNASCPAARAFMLLYMAAQIVGSCVELREQLVAGGKLQILAHHAASILCFGYSVFTHRMNYWACFSGLCEATTVFLNVLLLSKSKTALGAWISANLQPLLVLNGLMLWLSFILFRLVLFPMWLALFALDLAKMGPEGRAQLHAVELYIYPPVNAFLLVLSAIWFRKIHNGMLKVLRGGKSEPKPAGIKQN